MPSVEHEKGGHRDGVLVAMKSSLPHCGHERRSRSPGLIAGERVRRFAEPITWDILLSTGWQGAGSPVGCRSSDPPEAIYLARLRLLLYDIAMAVVLISIILWC